MIALKQTLIPKLVTIALPMWKRLDHLPHILRVIEAQDYPFINLLISDNGMNGNKLRDAVRTHYSRPYTFRQNPSIVEIPEHFNQLVQETTGEYFVLLMDDDEISSNYISTLVQQLERHPEASVAYAKQEIMNEDGVVIRKSNVVSEKVLSGAEFIRGLWQNFDIGFEAIGTFVARTAAIIAAGGYPNFRRGSGMENALIIKLCLNSHVALSPNCVWRWRVYESSYGWSVSVSDLATSTKDFMRYLNTDPRIRELARANPAQWKELKAALIHNEWQTYFWRWRDVYKTRLPYLQWMKAAFAMPFMLNYYRNVASVFRKDAKVQIKKLFGKQDPSVGEVGFSGRH
jgi:hypothetical protein